MTDYFKPAGTPLCDLKEIVLEADEFEAVRLTDLEGLYHAEAADQMKVSRQTVDRILIRAHRKIAQALVMGMALRIARQGEDQPHGAGRSTPPDEPREERDNS